MDIIHKIPTNKEKHEAFNKGLQAAKKGLHPMLNPYGIGTMQLFISWDNGYKSYNKKTETQ